MKLSELDDFPYRPPATDLCNMFEVEQSANTDGSVDTFYNLNVGAVIDGLEEVPSNQLMAYTVKNGDSLRLISYNAYGVSDYWWIIAKLNHIDDVLEELVEGRRLLLLEKNLMDGIYISIMSGGSDSN